MTVAEAMLTTNGNPILRASLYPPLADHLVRISVYSSFRGQTFHSLDLSERAPYT